MKIAVDARMIDFSGIGVFTKNIISRISGSKEFDFTLIGARDKLERFGLPIKEASAPIYGIREQFEIPSILRELKPSLFHCTHYNIPVFYGGRMVVNMYDLIHILYPDFLPSRAAHYYARFMFGLAAKKAAKIVTISEHTKRDLIKYLKVKESDIRMIYPAVGPEFIPSDDKRKKMKAKYGDYILYVGAVRPHKNVFALASAFCELKKGNKIPHKLVIAGKAKADYIDKINGLVTAQGQSANFIHIDNSDFDDIRALYCGADLFVFPSLYEGFGLPVLEAMASGCPVVSSNASSLPEATGDAALLVNPDKTDEIAEAIFEVLSKETLKKQLTAKGFERIKHFSWNKAAEETLALYRELGG